jgi:cell division cycle protein 20 (cofactor of APC complex)
MDIGYANSVLTERRTGKENLVESSASSVAYQKLLAETFNMNRRILTFKNKPPAPIEPIPRALLSPTNWKAKSKLRRHISQV